MAPRAVLVAAGPLRHGADAQNTTSVKADSTLVAALPSVLTLVAAGLRHHRPYQTYGTYTVKLVMRLLHRDVVRDVLREPRPVGAAEGDGVRTWRQGRQQQVVTVRHRRRVGARGK